LDSAVEGIGHGAGDAIGESAEGFGFDADYLFARVSHGREDVIKSGGALFERCFLSLGGDVGTKQVLGFAQDDKSGGLV